MEYNSHRILTNTVWGVFSYIWPVIFSILITPIIIKSLGIREYGVYMFFFTIMILLGLLDFGISTAVGKYLSEYYAQNDSNKINRLLGTALTIFSVIALVGFTIFVIGSLILLFFKAFSSYSQYSLGLIFAGLIFVTNALNSIYTITFSSLQRFDISSKIGMVTLTVQQLFILLIVISGYSINEIFIVQFIIGLIAFFIQKHYAQKILSHLPRTLLWDKTEAIKCYKFGLISSINNLSTSSLTYLDRLIIPFFLGPSGLTYYSVPGNISTRVPGLSSSLSAVLFPMTSGLQGIGEIEKIRTLYIRSFRLISVVAAAITVTILAYAYQILEHWISIDFAQKATSVLIILALTNFILAMANPLSNFLLGLGKLKFITIMSVTMAVLNTILLFIFLPTWGITGAAWAYLVSILPVIYMFYFTEKNLLSLTKRRGYYIKIVLSNIFVGLIVFMLAKLAFIHLINGLSTTLIICAITTLFYFIIYWLFGFFEREDIESIKLFLGRVLRLKP